MAIKIKYYKYNFQAPPIPDKNSYNLIKKKKIPFILSRPFVPIIFPTIIFILITTEILVFFDIISVVTSTGIYWFFGFGFVCGGPLIETIYYLRYFIKYFTFYFALNFNLIKSKNYEEFSAAIIKWSKSSQ